MSRTHAGKLMGLAGHSSSIESVEFFKLDNNGEIDVPFANYELIPKGILDWEEEIIVKWLSIFEKKWGCAIPCECVRPVSRGIFTPRIELKESQIKVAALIQKELERVYRWYISQVIKLTGHRNIGLSGGVALNCSANGMLLDSGLVNKLYVQPASNDAGVALGAAVYLLGSIPKKLFYNPYLGPAYSREIIYSFLQQSKVRFSEPLDFSFAVANAIADKKVVGWFNGRMEIGPRALGGRSILADPRDKDMHSIVNSIKSREYWRPFSPAVLEGLVSDFFVYDRQSPFMLIRNFMQPEKIQKIPSVVHVDGSVRPQTVAKDGSQYSKVLEEFYKLTGVPLIMNTSFNSVNEPIVCTPVDALKTFYSTGIDLLALNPFLIEK